MTFNEICGDKKQSENNNQFRRIKPNYLQKGVIDELIYSREF